MKNLILIAAMGKNHELGFQGDMPWKRNLPSDLRFFKNQTANHAMVMGRKTFESLPGLLPGRKHIVISHASKETLLQEKARTWPKPLDSSQVEVFNSLESFLKAYESYQESIYVIGGGTLYHALLPYAQSLYLTYIDANFLADVYFPFFDETKYTITPLDHVEENGYMYGHIRYDRK